MKFLGLDVLDDLVTKIKGKVETELSTKANITSLNLKQDKLTAGANITIDQNNVISATGGGGGGGGTTDYTQLSNKPSINNIILNGNKTLNDLNIQGKLTAGANINITNNEISSITVKVLEDSVTLQDGSTCDLATGFYYTDIWEVEFQGTSQTTIVVGQYQLFYFEGGQAQTFITPAFQVYYTTDTQKWQKFLNDYNTDVIVDDNYKIPTSKAVYDYGQTIEGKDNYSTTERVVGTWTNGKPLYEVVITGTTPTVSTDGSSQSLAFDISTDEVDFGFICASFVTQGTTGSTWTMPYYNNDMRFVKSSIYYLAGQQSLRGQVVSNGTVYNNTTYYLVIRFTKTTDTATRGGEQLRSMNTGSLVGMGDRVEISEQVTDNDVGEQTRTEVSENEVSGDQIEEKESGGQAKTVEAVGIEETKHED